MHSHTPHPSPTFWQRWRARRAAPARDAADMGTAFGLEMSLGASDQGSAEPAPTALPRRRGWWRRDGAR